MNRRITAAMTGICAALIMFGGAQSAGAAKDSVTISGKAYVFNHMDTGISNATIKVREFPKLSATTDEFGDYKLTVPNNSNVTPYILSGEALLTRRSFEDNSPIGEVQTHWNEVDLQTFHTRGTNLKNANFQAPADAEFAGLKAILTVPAREDGRPEQCAIVTTSSARNVRGVSYHAFWENTPHGVPGATSAEYPSIEGPVYFNESVIPDRTKTESSEDGGIIWPIVPTGTYRIVTSSPDARFASFLATCKPGRVINANPPWGAYELGPGEKPLGASNVAGSIVKAKAYKKNGKRLVSLRVKLGEELTLGGSYNSLTGPGIPALVGVLGEGTIPAGTHVLKTRMPGFGARQRIPVKLRVTMKDASGVSYTVTRQVTLPKLK